MKIIIVISTPELGGAQRVAINIAKWIGSNTNHTALLVAIGTTSRNSYDFSDLDFISLKKKNKVLGLRDIINERQPDLLLTMGVPLCLYTIPACIGTGVKHIVSERNDPVHFAGKWIVKYISRGLMRFADGFVFQTRDAQGFYGDKIAKRSVIIHNPLFSMNDMPSERYKGKRRKVIVSVGRLNIQKNQHLLINAFANIHREYPEFRLIIYGEGPEREALEKCIKNNGMQDYVSLPGSTNKVFEYLYDAYLFVLPSDFEGMPNALLEAMALGLPCISTNCPCGGPSELITSGANGLLVPVGDQKALETAIIRCISNPSEANRLGNDAFIIRETHDVNVICQQWMSYFESIINRRV